ncbi:MAG TPA: GGDEF domain-containing phosphodiesterase [Rhodocyclaceae bacterium]|nr:EAL domain-containing protein [Rhodocyclaceae bacterium]HMV52533.1 GGDEF domain-containing phosphodiesterase [Rhodocyclaceae bacterium]HMZ84727.1 GGDEF domain-containing phosphodiesterase [Rhodocyclaceae bacterium]HNA04455.1 GGDEF domain-containing phosphodiesterase [Rhodocyclaceae bacterium]HNB80070.1 GGDEF domain-containing phosphodiesterase [Rhodocyclaceae bacterium]
MEWPPERTELFPEDADNPAEREALQIVVDFEAVQARLAEFSIDDGTRAALRVFAELTDVSGFVSRLREDWRALDPSEVSEDEKGCALVYAAFSELFSQFAHWDFSPRWLNALTSAWLELIAAGVPADWLLAAANRLMDRSLALAFGDLPGGAQRSVDMVRAVNKVVMFLCAILGEAAAGYRESLHVHAEEFDERSGLPNLRQAIAVLDNAVAEGKPGEHVAVVVLRIEVGPVLLRMPAALSRRLLRQMVGRVHRALRPRDTLYLGAEWELVVVLPALANAPHVTLAMTRLLHLFDAAFPILGREYRLTPVAGAALFPEGGRDAETLLQGARLALHEAQRNGERSEIFRPEMDHSAARYAAIEQGFLQALRDDRLELYLQPQVDASTGACMHAEALLRWQHAAGETVAPQFIVEIAEEAGVSPQFSRWLVTRAARTLAEFALEGIPLRLSINLTANDLRDEELPDMIEQALTIWNVPADRLTLELTESAMISDEQHSLGILYRLRDLGCRLAVDDFGTGYSSMAYLRQLPLNELKIDQLFVRRMDESPQDREIVRSMIQLAQGLRLEVVAEGVETKGTWTLLSEYGCQRVQGYYFSKPIAVTEFVRWWHERRGELVRPAD